MLFRRVCVFRLMVGAIVALASRERIEATEIYVDNLRGSAAFDGVTPEAASATSGPTRSIGHALKLAKRGDTIIVRNTGVPYYESLSVVGDRLSGSENLPFKIQSKGAVIDGSRAIPDAAWQNVGGDVWRIKPWRKGYYQLLLKGKPVPGAITPRSVTKLPQIPVGQWTAWKGSIYYRAAAMESPLKQPFRFAFRRVGLTLYNVRDVRISGLVFRGFQLDGINAHDLCERVVLENVKLEANARAGVAVGGTSAVVLRNCEVNGNRLHSALVTELGGLKVEDSKLEKPPTLPKK